MNGARYARSLLFVPATSERKIDRAFASAADGVIVDLEDAVAVSEKPAARRALGALLSVPRRLPVYVRVNATSTPFCLQDMLAVTVAGVAGVVLPKAESADEMKTIDWLMLQLETERGLPPRGCPVMPIIETARGLASVDAIAAATPRIKRLLVRCGGSGGRHDDRPGRRHRRDRAGALRDCARIPRGLARASVRHRVCGSQGWRALRATAERARALGFSGRPVSIRPRSTSSIRSSPPAPASSSVPRASSRLSSDAEASGHAAVALDGQMIDYPVVEKARRLLERRRRRAGAPPRCARLVGAETCSAGSVTDWCQLRMGSAHTSREPRPSSHEVMGDGRMVINARVLLTMKEFDLLQDTPRNGPEPASAIVATGPVPLGARAWKSSTT